MADTFHQDITVADGIHIIQRYEVANEAARLALVSPPKGSIVNQTDDNSWWVVLSTTPTFHRMDTASGDLVSVDLSANANLSSTDVESALLEIQANVEEAGVGEGGFSNRTDSTLSYTAGSRTFEIAPTTVSFDFYVQGQKYTKLSADTVNWTDVEGMHFFYYDENGALQHTTDESFLGSTVIPTLAFVAALYWDATNNAIITELDERHGRHMAGATHAYLHQVLGSQWVSGLALGNFDIDGAGSTAAHAQFSVSDGQFRDEDILFTVTDGSPQELSLIAEIPILYRDGANGDWRIKTADVYPVIYNGDSTPYAGTRAPYNQFTGATWQLTEVANNDYFLVHYFAMNDTSNHIVGILGQAQYGTVGEAQAGAQEELDGILFGSLPSPEFCPIGTVIFQTGTGMSNVPKVATVSASDGDYVDWRDARGSSGGGGGGGDPTMGGDVSGTASSATVTAIQGSAVDATAPATADILVWDGAQWANPPVSGDVTMTSGGAFTVTALRGVAIQATAPSTGDILIYDGATWNHFNVKQDLSMDTSGNFTVIGIQGRDVHDTGSPPSDGEVLTWVTANNRWEAQPGGSGSTNATQLQGTNIDATPPTDAQILIYDGNTDLEWEAKSISGDISFSREGVVVVTHLRGTEIQTTAPTNGQILTYDGTTSLKWEPATVGGDLTVAYDGSPVLNYTVGKIQGNAVSATSPSTGFAYVWDGAAFTPTEVLQLNGSGRVTADIHYLDGFGNFVLPNYTSNPTSLDDGQMFYHSVEQRVKVRDHNIKWFEVAWVEEVLLLDGSNDMTGSLNMNTNGIVNIDEIELPAATSSAGLHSPTLDGNIGLRIDATGDGTVGIYISDGTSWVALPVTVNSSGRFIGNIHFLDNEGRMTLPQWTSAPGSPLDDGEIYFDPTLDEVRVRSTTLGGWMRMQSAQKLTWGCAFRVLSTRTDSTFYGPTDTANITDGIADWDASYGDDGGSNPVVSAVDYPYARGFLVPESGTITKILFTVQPHDGAVTANNNVRVNALIVTPNYGTDNSTTQVLVATSSVSRTFLNTEQKIEKIELTLNNTSVAEGDIIVPVLTSGDFSAMSGGPTGNVTITVEVNKGV